MFKEGSRYVFQCTDPFSPSCEPAGTIENVDYSTRFDGDEANPCSGDLYNLRSPAPPCVGAENPTTDKQGWLYNPDLDGDGVPENEHW